MIFIKNKEDFKCEKCGTEVIGNGFTNHCPNCLWSKHVDISPGDRAGECHGMMEPTGIEKRGKDYIIVHKCQKCGFVKKNKAEKNDSFQIIIQIASATKGIT